ncbi:alanine--glyoxylate aminotransferase 2, mitochondrial [Papilio machaon]|uniref:alanine--glyoxylate aminotransferase 2, mitochondrial n=1 Tax=Papilio machaon TaxID=76193 RepID=UPI001E66361A|nr:alanine--glyoxylate aminotransferase 2, mitochondrial [Papilio machaon]
MAYKVLKRLDNKFVRWCSTMNMPKCDFKPKKYTGPSVAKTEQIKSTNIPPAVYNIYKKPLVIHQGHMQWLYDHEGRRYLDLLGGIATISVGHSHPKVAAALQEQIGKLWHTTNIYRHPKIYEYAEKLIAKFPKKLEVVYFVNSGTEANDLAVVLSRMYTGNVDIVSLQGSYHGCSSGLMGLTSTQSFRHPNISLAGYYHAMVPDPYRGIWGGCRDSLSQVPGACSCRGDCVTSDKYAHQLSELLNHSVPSGRLAAMFAEPIQGVHGNLQYPKGYLRKAREIVKKNGGLFVADEVQTGFGRTGDTFWCFESEGIVPDIVTMAKGIGNGFPLAAVVTTREIADAHTRTSYFNTFGGNALASTVGKAVLEVIEEEKIQENSKTVGKYFLEQMMQLQKQYPIIGDVRGKGLMIGLDMVKPGTKEPIDNGAEIFETIRDLGVLIGWGGRWNHNLRMTPPMCINKEDVDFAIAVLDEAFKRHSP